MFEYIFIYRFYNSFDRETNEMDTKSQDLKSGKF